MQKSSRIVTNRQINRKMEYFRL